MSNMYGKDKFHDRQKAVLQKSAQKIENDSGWSQDNFLRGYAEEILPASGAELSFGELCAIGEQVEQEAAFSAKEAMRNKIKARRDAERYKSTGTDSEQRTPNPFEDSSAIATESPKNEDTLNTMRKHADAQPTKSAGIKTSKKQSLVETTRELKKYIHIISCGGVLYYHNEYYYTQLDSKQLIKLYRQNVDYELNNESSLRGYKDLYDCLVTDPQIECSEPEDEPIYAPLENGILDLMEWKLYPHSPDQITFTCIKAKYDPQAKCQIFEEYLQRVTGGDSLLSERVWMAIGYLLIYPARGKFFIFMKGIGNSGKSVLGSFIRRLYPKESISSIRLKQMKNEFGMSSLANAVINFDMDTGTSILRPEWSKLYRVLKDGDTVVFDSVSRMSRNAEEGFSLYEDLYHKGIRLIFLKEHHIDTETYKKALSGSIAMTGTNVDFILKGINEYLMVLAKEQIKLAFEQSEKEVANLHQRTREGLVTAKLNGKQVGRKKGTGFETKKSKAAKEKIRIHCKAFGGTLDDVECMKLTGLARNTYYKYKRQIRAGLADEGKT